MSLWMSVAVYDEDGAWHTLDLGTGGNLMGFEVFRNELWGSSVMKALGLTMLPSLGDGAYLVLKSPDQIDQLEQEAFMIQNNMVAVAEALGEGMVYSLERTYLRNLFHAVKVARLNNGEISIG